MNLYTMFLNYLTLDAYIIRTYYYSRIIILRIILFILFIFIIHVIKLILIYTMFLYTINSLAIKSAISIAIRLCRILKINIICNFKNVKDLKLYLENVDLTQIDL